MGRKRNATGSKEVDIAEQLNKQFQRAIEKGDAGKLQDLLSNSGHNFDKDGGLVSACNSAHVPIIRLLIDNGANVNHVKTVKQFLVDPYPLTPMNAICEVHWMSNRVNAEKCIEIIGLLLAHGADIEKKSGRFEHTPLREACFGDPSVMKFLLDKGADPNKKDDKGNTYLHHVCTNPNSLEKVKALVEKGADPNVRNQKHATPLDMAEAHLSEMPYLPNSIQTVAYLKSVTSQVGLFYLLDKADVTHKITKDTEKIGPDVMVASNSTSNSNSHSNKSNKEGKKYFYDVRDVSSNGEIPRVFNAELLDKMNKSSAKNPFSRAEWPLNNVNEMKQILRQAPTKSKKASQVTQEGGKAHTTYKGRSYVVRIGSRGGKYILVKGEKIYV